MRRNVERSRKTRVFPLVLKNVVFFLLLAFLPCCSPRFVCLLKRKLGLFFCLELLWRSSGVQRKIVDEVFTLKGPNDRRSGGGGGVPVEKHNQEQEKRAFPLGPNQNSTYQNAVKILVYVVDD